MGTKVHKNKTQIRTQIYLTQEEYEYLRHQSETKTLSIAEVVRQLIEEKMPKEEDYENNPLFVIGRDGFSMGRKEGSIKHDDYIYKEKE